ncbi:MAG: 5'/3'-nucleotidase SurE [Oscillospiraceae bacterium]|nr:5'/3'-nucleotidase SurE [Oscillospiraceae bacterium]
MIPEKKLILITNDDGIAADGLIRLAEAAARFGEVWVVAPDGQRSAASHAITLHTHLDVFPCEFPVSGVHAYTCSGMPGDCVRVGCLNITPRKPDVVLSGINRGFNVASDIQYSGTAGAAFEAAFQGIPAIAFSEDAADCHAVTDACLHDLLTELLPMQPPPGQIINVNIPCCPLSEFKGILRNRTVSAGMVYRDHYNMTETLPDGGMRFMVEGDWNEDAEPGTDFRAVTEKYISVGLVNNIGYPVLR